MGERICVVLTADELEMLVNAVNYERNNNFVTDDYRDDLDKLEQYLAKHQEEV
jgi:5'-deoxynucleotidase YfbR-like HD superfamily hydrolase